MQGLQAAIDKDAPGWRVSHYVAVIGVDRIGEDGEVETDAAVYHAAGQADYITNGLLGKADELMAWEGYEEEED
ncbi:MAG: hypothetical protein WBH51_01450 [Mycolicibacter algericus]|uniref:DUF7213 family protein n=1 Tax=Mycolicibacter algericus TaxID=1288388 RepID=UPI003C778B1C